MRTEVDSNKKVLAEHINRLNKIAVLNLIRQEGEISRADIVKRLKLSAPTVTRIVDSLINIEGLACQSGVGESSGGRPPMIVRFNGDKNYVIGIDWGRTHIHGVVADLNAEIQLTIDIPINPHSEFDNDLTQLISLIEELISKCKFGIDKIVGIGLAVAGFYNHKSSKVEFSANFGWRDVDVRKRIAEHFDIPVTVDNVSRVMALGELLYGIGGEVKNFVFTNVGYGIGSGIILDGKPFLGFDGFAGEIGHNRISSKCPAMEPRTCTCGKNNCLECYASGRGIAKTARNEIENYPDSILNELCGGDKSKINAKLVATAMHQGDAFATRLFSDAATMLGVALANISNIINPEFIVIGGGVANAGDKFIDMIRTSFNQEIIPNVNRSIDIQQSRLLGNEAVMGAVALTLKEVLNLNITG